MNMVVDLRAHIASNVVPGTQLLDWYEPVDFTDLDMAPVVGQVWLEGKLRAIHLEKLTKLLQSRVVV